MLEFNEYKENMIKQQLRTNGIGNKIILDLFNTLPRHEFVPDHLREFAYSDTPIQLAHGQQMLTPEEEGLLLQSLHLKGNETVLEVGTGSGFLTGMLSRLAKKVISIDCFEEFSQEAQRKTDARGYTNIAFITGDASQGWMDKAPYDVIVLTGAIPAMTKTLELQIMPGGKLFAIIGNSPIMSGCLLTFDHNEQWHETMLFETETPLLINKLQHEEFLF